MKQLLMTLLAVLTVQLPAGAIEIENGTIWTDGMVALRAESAPDGGVALEGGTMHEGGYRVSLGPGSAPGHYVVRPVEGADDEMCMLGGTADFGDRVTLETVDGTTLLVARRDGGTVTCAYQKLDGSLRDKMLLDQRVTYAGTYVDEQGRQWTFTLDGALAEPGMAEPKPYAVMDIYDMPSEVVLTASGRYLVVRASTTGLNLYGCQFDAEQEDYGSDELTPVARLRRIGSPWASAGRFPFTAQVLIDATIASQYDRATLRLMRNEILARHGYQFQSDDLQRHFGQQPWYRPNPGGNAAIELSPVEQMNAAIIGSIERIDNRDWMTTEQGL